eukprot:5222115-Amphidinium_carterae.1
MASPGARVCSKPIPTGAPITGGLSYRDGERSLHVTACQHPQMLTTMKTPCRQDTFGPQAVSYTHLTLPTILLV